jgi:HAD superfamily hydrolase (TIGR01509 family)
MIRAVIFDCFGVLTTDGWLPFKRRYFESDPILWDRATELNHRVDAGLIAYDEFVESVAVMAAVPTLQTKKAIENNVANDELFSYIEHELRSRYALGMLSNAAANWLSELFTTDQISLFSAIVLSYETGMPKPDNRAYEVIADRLGVAISDCVLVDDQERYCSGAIEAGMRAILYRNFLQMRTDLEKLLSH